MKKCPTCEKTFDDAMRFCQVDGTPLVDDVPFDPYATIVGTPANITPPPAQPSEPAAADAPPSVAAISVPEEVLDIPDADPLKTVFVSDAEMKQVLGGDGDATPSSDDEGATKIQPETTRPEPPPPSFSDMAPPPSPFSEPPATGYEAVPAPPMFLEPERTAPNAFEAPPPTAPMQEWTPPPPPEASWQNQEIGSNTPFQPPPAGAGGENKTLAIVSLVCGILSCLCCLSVVTGPAGVITGFLAKKNIDENPGVYGGRGLAIGGMVTGAIGFLIGIAVIILQVFFGVLGSLG